MTVIFADAEIGSRCIVKDHYASSSARKLGRILSITAASMKYLGCKDETGAHADPRSKEVGADR